MHMTQKAPSQVTRRAQIHLTKVKTKMEKGRNQRGQEGQQEKFEAEDSRARGVPVTRNPLSLKDHLLKTSGILNEGL